MRRELFKIIERTPFLDWQILTKRPENIMRMVPYHWRDKFPDNVWIGTSVEEQKEAVKRIPILMKVPAKVRFISCEPLLSKLDITNKALGNAYSVPTNWYTEPVNGKKIGIEWTDPGDDYIGLNWVITGAESGNDARLSHPEWFINLRDQCIAAGISFFFKQWGAYVPYEPIGEPTTCTKIRNMCTNEQFDIGSLNMIIRKNNELIPGSDFGGKWNDVFDDAIFCSEVEEKDVHFLHVGRKHTEALLEGIEYKQFPV